MMIPNDFVLQVKEKRESLTCENWQRALQDSSNVVEKRAIFWVLFTGSVTTAVERKKLSVKALSDSDIFVRMIAVTFAGVSIDVGGLPTKGTCSNEELIYWLRSAAKARSEGVIEICDELNLNGEDEIRRFTPTIVSELRSSRAIAWLRDFMSQAEDFTERLVAGVGLLKCGDISERSLVEDAIRHSTTPISLKITAAGALLGAGSEVGFQFARHLSEFGDASEKSLLAVSIVSALGSPKAPKGLQYSEWINHYLSFFRQGDAGNSD